MAPQSFYPRVEFPPLNVCEMELRIYPSLSQKRNKQVLLNKGCGFTSRKTRRKELFQHFRRYIGYLKDTINCGNYRIAPNFRGLNLP